MHLPRRAVLLFISVTSLLQAVDSLSLPATVQLAESAVRTNSTSPNGNSIENDDHARLLRDVHPPPCQALAQELPKDFLNGAIPKYRFGDAELALSCLKSIPFNKDDAVSTLDAIASIVQFQSTLSYLKDSQYMARPVDIMKELDDLKSSLDQFEDEYSFQIEVGNLFYRCKDMHLAFNGRLFNGIMRFELPPSFDLVSVSMDGGLPKLYRADDLMQNFWQSWWWGVPSPVKLINGIDAVTYLQDQSDANSPFEPNTGYNVMVRQPTLGIGGEFRAPGIYPGATTTLTFENGKEMTARTIVRLMSPKDWVSGPFDGESLYQRWVAPISEEDMDNQLRVPDAISVPDVSLNHLSRRGPVLAGFASEPDPVGKRIQGKVIDLDSTTELAILKIPSFGLDPEKTDIQDFLIYCLKYKIKDLVIDLRGNGGGFPNTAQKIFTSLFPTMEPSTAFRIRSHEAAKTLIQAYAQPEQPLLDVHFSVSILLDLSRRVFSDWQSMYGPVFHGDWYSNPFLDAWISWKDIRLKEPAFDPSAIIILTDGRCGSACVLATDALSKHNGLPQIKTVVVGGRPIQSSSMTPTGSTKGLVVLDANEIIDSWNAISGNPGVDKSLLPSALPKQFKDASINFWDGLRQNETPDLPIQFQYDRADCRMWYTPDTLFDDMKMWKAVYWAMNGAGDRWCVKDDL